MCELPELLEYTLALKDKKLIFFFFIIQNYSARKYLFNFTNFIKIDKLVEK